MKWILQKWSCSVYKCILIISIFINTTGQVIGFVVMLDGCLSSSSYFVPNAPTPTERVGSNVIWTFFCFSFHLQACQNMKKSTQNSCSASWQWWILCKYIVFTDWTSSSETQGQLVGAGGNKLGKNWSVPGLQVRRENPYL